MIARRSEAAQAMQRRLVNMREAGRLLGCSEWKVRELVWSGRLPFVRVGRLHMVEIGDIEKFIDSNKAINRAERHLAG